MVRNITSNAGKEEESLRGEFRSVSGQMTALVNGAFSIVGVFVAVFFIASRWSLEMVCLVLCVCVLVIDHIQRVLLSLLISLVVAAAELWFFSSAFV